MYSIYYRQIQPPITEAAWNQVNVTNGTATNHTITLACGRQYTIEITAWNEMGQSDRSKSWIIKTKSGTFTELRFGERKRESRGERLSLKQHSV